MGEDRDNEPVTNQNILDWLCPKSAKERYKLFKEIGLQLEEEGQEDEIISKHYKQLSAASSVELKRLTSKDIVSLTKVKIEWEDVQSKNESEETSGACKTKDENLCLPCTSTVRSLCEDESVPVIVLSDDENGEEHEKTCNTQRTIFRDHCSSPMSDVKSSLDDDASIVIEWSEEEEKSPISRPNSENDVHFNESNKTCNTQRTQIEECCLPPTTTDKGLKNNGEPTEVKPSNVRGGEKQLENISKYNIRCKKPDENVEVSSVDGLSKMSTDTAGFLLNQNEPNIIENGNKNDLKTYQPKINNLDVKHKRKNNMRQGKKFQCSKRANIDPVQLPNGGNTNNKVEFKSGHPFSSNIADIRCSKDDNNSISCDSDIDKCMNENTIITEKFTTKTVSSLARNNCEQTEDSTEEPCELKEQTVNNDVVLEHNKENPVLSKNQNVQPLEQTTVEALISVRKNLSSTISDPINYNKVINQNICKEIVGKTHGTEEIFQTKINKNCEKAKELNFKSKDFTKEYLFGAETSDSPKTNKQNSISVQSVLIDSNISTEIEEGGVQTRVDNTERQSDEPEIDISDLIENTGFCKAWPLNIENNPEHPKEVKLSKVNKSYSDDFKESFRQVTSHIKMINNQLTAKRSSGFPAEPLRKSKVRKLSVDNHIRTEIQVDCPTNKQQSSNLTKVSEPKSQMIPSSSNDQQATFQTTKTTTFSQIALPVVNENCSIKQQMKVITNSVTQTNAPPVNVNTNSLTQQNNNPSEYIESSINSQRRMSSETTVISSLTNNKSVDYNGRTDTLQDNQISQIPGGPVNSSNSRLSPQTGTTLQTTEAGQSYDNSVNHVNVFQGLTKQVSQVHNNQTLQDIKTSESLVQQKSQTSMNTLMEKGQTCSNLQTAAPEEQMHPQCLVGSPIINSKLASLFQDAFKLFLRCFGNSNNHTQSIIPQELQSSMLQFLKATGWLSGLSDKNYMNLFLGLYVKYFNDSVCTRVNKIAEILHLAVADCNHRNECKTRALRLSSDLLRKEEINRAQKDYQDMLDLRGLRFRDIFLSLLGDFKNCEHTMFFVLYFRIIQALLNIDSENVRFISYIPSVVSSLLRSSNLEVPAVIKNIFEELSGESLLTSYIFVKKCLVTFCVVGYCGPGVEVIVKLAHLDPFPIQTEQVRSQFLINQLTPAQRNITVETDPLIQGIATSRTTNAGPPPQRAFLPNLANTTQHHIGAHKKMILDASQHSTAVEAGSVSQQSSTTSRTTNAGSFPTSRTSTENLGEAIFRMGTQLKKKLDAFQHSTAVEVGRVSQETGTTDRITNAGPPPQQSSFAHLGEAIRHSAAQQKMRLNALDSKHIAEQHIIRNVNISLGHTQAPNQQNRIQSFTKQNMAQAANAEMRTLGHQRVNQVQYQQQMVQRSPQQKLPQTYVLQQMLQAPLSSNIKDYQRNMESSNVQNVQPCPIQNMFKTNSPQQQQMAMKQRTGEMAFQDTRVTPNVIVNNRPAVCRIAPPYSATVHHRPSQNTSGKVNEQPWGLAPQGRFPVVNNSGRVPIQNRQPVTNSSHTIASGANFWLGSGSNNPSVTASPKSGSTETLTSTSQSEDDLCNPAIIENEEIPCSTGCGKTATLVCSLCKSAFYCNTDCQSFHWYNTHSRACIG